MMENMVVERLHEIGIKKAEVITTF